MISLIFHLALSINVMSRNKKFNKEVEEISYRFAISLPSKFTISHADCKYSAANKIKSMLENSFSAKK